MVSVNSVTQAPSRSTPSASIAARRADSGVGRTRSSTSYPIEKRLPRFAAVAREDVGAPADVCAHENFSIEVGGGVGAGVAGAQEVGQRTRLGQLVAL